LVAKLGHDVSCPYIGKGGEEIGFLEGDAVGEPELGGVALGDCEGGWGDVGGVDFGVGKFLGEGNGDAAGACAYVDDGQALAGELGVAAGAELADG